MFFEGSPSTVLFLPVILERIDCRRHGCLVGEYCFVYPSLYSETNLIGGICNDRAIRAGMNNSIKPASLVKFRPKVGIHG